MIEAYNTTTPIQTLAITGASGTGKSTIARCLCDWLRIERLPGHTTRDMRSGEIDGFDFFYICVKEFFANWANHFYVDLELADTQYNDNYYGSPQTWRNADSNVSLFTPTSSITAAWLAKVCPDLTWVHLYAPEASRAERLSQRSGTTEAEISYRLNSGDSSGLKSEARLNIDTTQFSLEETIQLIYWSILCSK